MCNNYRSAIQPYVRHKWRVLLGIVALLCLSVPAFAYAKSLNGTFLGKGTGREVAFNHHGKPLSDWAGTLKFKLDSGEDLLVFCIQIDVRVRSGDRYRSDGAVLALPNGCQIRYLLDTYPASTAQSADEAAARQLAIWAFSDGLDPATIADTTVRDRTIALVSEATGKPCPKRRTEAPDLTIAPPTARAGVGQAVAYTVHASSEDAGQPLTISLAGPAVFSDTSGKNLGQQQPPISLNAQSEATVWALITGAGQTTVTVALPYRLEAGTVYSQLDDKTPTQRLVMAQSLDLVAQASAQLPGLVEETPTASALPTVTPATPSPTEQAREQRPTAVASVVATAEAQPSSTAAAEQPTAQLPTAAQATTAGGSQPLPARLPNTGRQAAPTWPALAVAGLLLGAGWALRRRTVPEQDHSSEWPADDIGLDQKQRSAA